MWAALWALSLSNVIEQIDRYVFQVSPIPYLNYSSYSYSLLAGTLFSVVYCFGNITFSCWNEYFQWNRVYVVAIACLVSSIALGCIPLVDSFWEQALLRMVMGLAQSPITTFSASLLKEIFPEEWRGVAFGVFDSGTFFGFAFSLTVGTVIYHALGWQAPYYLFSLIGVLYSGVLVFVAKDPDRQVVERVPYASVKREDDADAGSPIHRSEEEGRYISLARDGAGGSSGAGEEQPLTNMVTKKIYKVLLYCNEYKSIPVMCLACLIRFCGGYCYAYYVGLFFSELTVKQSSSGGLPSVSGDFGVACTFSYESNVTQSAACSSDFPYCINSQCAALSATPWHNVGMPHEKFEVSFAFSVVAGSVLGCVLGGYLGDAVSSHTSLGVPGRMVVAGLSLVVAAPMYVILYNADYPYCFLGLAFGGLFGEMYYGLAMAVLAEMVPKKLFIVLTSIYISFLIGAGSNATLFVPLLRNHFDTQFSHTFEIDAAPTYTESQENPYTVSETFYTTESGSQGLTRALSFILATTYGVAGVLMLISVPMVANDLKRIKEGGKLNEYD